MPAPTRSAAPPLRCLAGSFKSPQDSDSPAQRRTFGRARHLLQRASGQPPRPEPRPVLARRRPGVPLEQVTEERHVLIADLPADLLDRAVRGLEVVPRPIDPQP